MAGEPSPARGARMTSSEISGFYRKGAQERWQVLREFGGLSDAELATIGNTGALAFDQVNRMIENVVGAHTLPHRDEILASANEKDPVLGKYGGGAKDVEVRVVETARGPMVVTHLLVDCRDAMGANAINTMAEAIAPRLEA